MNFKLLATDGNEYSLDSFEEELLVLYVYPKDNTSGCSIEAQEFAELNDEFMQLGARIIGLSKDSVNSHKKFTEKFGLPFLLISDTEREVLAQLNTVVEKKMYGKPVRGTERSTFIFDAERNIIKEFRAVKPSGHAQDVLDFIKEYKNGK